MANVGDLISASTYNDIVSKIDLVLGVGDGAQQGYGRAIKSSSISSGTVVSSELMQNLYDDLVKARTHQRGASFTWDNAVDGINTPSAGEYIGIYAADIGPASGDTSFESTNDVAEGFLDFEQAAQDIVDDQYEVDASQLTVTQQVVASTEGAAWNGTTGHDVIVTWVNANERRYFFNSGGHILFDASLVGGTSVAGNVTTTPPGTKDEIWQTMFNTMGTIKFGRTDTTSTGSGTGSLIGNFDITSSTPQRIFTKSGSGVYSENEYYINAYESGSNGNSIRFEIRAVDNDVGDSRGGAGSTPIDENVTGTTTSTVTSVTATGILNISEPAFTNIPLSGSAGVNYTLGVSPNTSVNEGTQITITIDGNASNGTLVPWSMSGISTSDISLSSLSGNFNIQNGTDDLIFTVSNDALTEGPETIEFTAAGQTVNIEVVDTSRTPVYTLIRGATSVNEGSTITFRLDTENVTPGTFPYTITGIQAADLDPAVLTGDITTTGTYASATGSVTLTTVADNTTEGSQVMTFSVAGKSTTVTINDTSTTGINGTNIVNVDGFSSATCPAGTTLIARLWFRTDGLVDRIRSVSGGCSTSTTTLGDWTTGDPTTFEMLVSFSNSTPPGITNWDGPTTWTQMGLSGIAVGLSGTKTSEYVGYTVVDLRIQIRDRASGTVVYDQVKSFGYEAT